MLRNQASISPILGKIQETGLQKVIVTKTLRVLILGVLYHKNNPQLICPGMPEKLCWKQHLYSNGDVIALSNISGNLRKLVAFYPKHIEKEDKVYLPAARAYVTESEDQAMLAEFWDFDRRIIHDKYESVVEELKQTE